MNTVGLLVKILFACILLVKITHALKCCDDGVFLVTRDFMTRICENNKNISIPCTIRNLITNSHFGDYGRYLVRTDKKGDYLDVYGMGYIVRSPYFCTGQIKSDFSERPRDIVMVCTGQKIWYPDIIKEEKPPSAPFRERILPFLIEMLNFISAVMLLITALIYGFLQDLQDNQGICTFHFAFSTAMLHGTIFYLLAFNINGLLPNLCITNLYIQMYILLCSITWWAIMGYNSWIHIKSRDIIDKDMLIRRYRYIGYGFPLIMIFISNIYAHQAKLYREFRLEMQCTTHQSGVLMVSMALPVIIASLSNCYFFIDTQKYLWNSPALELRSEKSTLKMMKYRLLLSGKLFFITGVSSSLFFICVGIYQITDSRPFFLYTAYFLGILVSSQGISIFLLLVFFRKRVLKAVSRRWLTQFNIFPARWRNATDSETAEDEVNVIVGHSFMFEKEKGTDAGTLKLTSDSESKEKNSSENIFFS